MVSPALAETPPNLAKSESWSEGAGTGVESPARVRVPVLTDLGMIYFLGVTGLRPPSVRRRHADVRNRFAHPLEAARALVRDRDILSPRAVAPARSAAGRPGHGDRARPGHRCPVGEPISQVDVVLLPIGPRAYTADDGRFVLDHVAAGRCTLTVTRMGYAPLRRELTIAEGVDTTLELRLTRSALPLDEVTVTPGSFSFMGRGTGTRQTMSREDVQSVPQIGNDIFRAVNRLPGLASNDYSAHFGIRGGRHDETLITLDGLELYEPLPHQGLQRGRHQHHRRADHRRRRADDGRIPGAIRQQAQRSVRHHFAHAGCESHRHRREHELHELERHGARALLERQGFLARVRPRRLHGPHVPSHRPGRPAPAQLRGRVREAQLSAVGPAGAFTEALHAGDRYKYEVSGTTGFEDSILTSEVANNEYQNSYVWATLKSAFSPRTTVTTLLSGGIVKRSRDGFERNVLLTAPYYAVRNERTFRTYGALQDWSLSLSERNLLSFGVDFREQYNRDTSQSIVYQDPTIRNSPTRASSRSSRTPTSRRPARGSRSTSPIAGASQPRW